MNSGGDKRVNNNEESSSDSTTQSVHNEVRHMAIAVMALLKKDKKKALQQVKYLIKQKKDLAHTVFTSDIGGWTPVHACALRGSKKLLKTMLQAGISTNVTMGQPEGLPGECTLLHVAANRTDKKILDYLLHHGADVNARDSDGNTALYYAKQSNKDSVRLLISCGATLDDSFSINHEQDHHHHHQTQQQHPRVKETTLARHSSTLSLKHEPTSALVDKLHKKQQHIAPSPLSATASASKSHFLTVPSTNFYSSTPCINLQGTAASSSAKALKSSNSSSNIFRSFRFKSKNNSKLTSSNNNNNASVTNLNSKGGLKKSVRSEYASSESLTPKIVFHSPQTNSD